MYGLFGCYLYRGRLLLEWDVNNIGTTIDPTLGMVTTADTKEVMDMDFL